MMLNKKISYQTLKNNYPFNDQLLFWFLNKIHIFLIHLQLKKKKKKHFYVNQLNKGKVILRYLIMKMSFS